MSYLDELLAMESYEEYGDCDLYDDIDDITLESMIAAEGFISNLKEKHAAKKEAKHASKAAEPIYRAEAKVVMDVVDKTFEKCKKMNSKYKYLPFKNEKAKIKDGKIVLCPFSDRTIVRNVTTTNVSYSNYGGSSTTVNNFDQNALDFYNILMVEIQEELDKAKQLQCEYTVRADKVFVGGIVIVPKKVK